MLRRPSDYDNTRLEEGCSSTAIVRGEDFPFAAWGNLTDCGSAKGKSSPRTAVP